MALMIVSPAKHPDAWIQALRQAAPGIEVLTRHEVGDPTSVTFALAWSHPPGIFAQYPNLKCISSMGAGVDHLLRDKDIPKHIPIVRIIEPKLSHDMFEFALAVIMNRLRGLTHYRQNQQQHYWKKQQYLNMADVRVGVMGTGVIGNYVAEQLQKTGFNVHGWSRSQGKETSYPKFHGVEQLQEFLSQSNILICLLPLTTETQGILNRNNLQELPKGAWVINLGRGGHVVDEDMIHLLNSGHIDGANLDVFREEPLPEAHPFWKHPKIFITPHIASLTTPESVAPQVVDNYFRALEGRPLLNVVDHEKGY
jgi:glyoxylate/hydroxypyruvate reductase